MFLPYFHPKYRAFSALSHNNCDRRQLPRSYLFNLPSSRKENLDSHWRDQRGNWYCRILLQVGKNKFWFQLDNKKNPCMDICQKCLTTWLLTIPYLSRLPHFPVFIRWLWSLLLQLLPWLMTLPIFSGFVSKITNVIMDRKPILFTGVTCLHGWCVAFVPVVIWFTRFPAFLCY
jgi:hypothetical protein